MEKRLQFNKENRSQLSIEWGNLHAFVRSFGSTYVFATLFEHPYYHTGWELYVLVLRVYKPST